MNQSTRYLTPEQAAEYSRLSTLAREIEDKLQSLIVATVQSEIPEHAKLATLAWIDRTQTFRGLSYFLTPQEEWMGGDSSDPRNFKLRAPHIAK